MEIKWLDTQLIAEMLYENHPEVDPQWVRYTDMHTWICQLTGFIDDPEKSNEKILEAIQMAWIDEADVK
ncbi:MAG: Fe-S cluster assembly protein IscX [Ostreibacterium sp.]